MSHKQPVPHCRRNLPRLLLVLFLLLSPLLPALGAELKPQEVARWITGQGGVVETDASSSITGVNLGYDWVTDADLDLIAALKDLRKLDLSLSLITDAGMERLKASDGITDLNLYAVEHITDIGISYIRGWKTLERLNLHGTDITDTSLQQYVSGLTALRSLDIGYTQVTNLGLESLALLRNLQNLTIGANKINGSGLHVLELLPKLALLNLSGRQKRNTEIWSAVLTDFDMKVVGGLKRLQSLNVGGIKITDLGAAELKQLQELRWLDLSQTQVTDKVFETLTQLPNLQRLSLWRVKRIDDGAAPQLARMGRLTTLDLSETGITDRGLEQMQSMKQLRRLYVGGSAVTAAGVAAFRRASPECEVSWK